MAQTTSQIASRGTKSLAKAFFTAADDLPEPQRNDIIKAALALIRESLKTAREKAAVAKAKAKAAPVKAVAKAKPATKVKPGVEIEKQATPSKRAARAKPPVLPPGEAPLQNGAATGA